jgi:hypothetical protein
MRSCEKYKRALPGESTRKHLHSLLTFSLAAAEILKKSKKKNEQEIRSEDSDW